MEELKLSAKMMLTIIVLIEISIFCKVSAEFENSWTMYMEQPCCSGNGPHHVRHHRG